MALSILHGGMIRYSVDVWEDSAAWVAGNVLQLNTAGQAELSTGTAVGVRGLAIEPSPSSAATSADSLAGVPCGDKVSLLLDEAVVETDQITSGVTLKVNQVVYPDVLGNITDTTNKAVDQVIGVMLQDAAWNGTARLLWTVQY